MQICIYGNDREKQVVISLDVKSLYIINFKLSIDRMFPLYDAHTHLNTESMAEERQKYVDLFVEAGGSGLVNSWASDFYNRKGIEIASKSSSLYPDLIVKTTLGLHPLECVENIITHENLNIQFQTMKDYYDANKQHIVAIWECWIDLHFSNGYETLEIQKALFKLQCDWARELDLPIVIHSRDGFEETMEILKNYTDLVVYIHCRSYGTDEYRYLENNFPKLFVGFCGNITYKNAPNLRDTLSIVHPSQVIMETDAPYLAPQAIRGQTNHPANLTYNYEFCAAHLWVSLPEFAAQIEVNFKRLYSL